MTPKVPEGTYTVTLFMYLFGSNVVLACRLAVWKQGPNKGGSGFKGNFGVYGPILFSLMCSVHAGGLLAPIYDLLHGI